MTIKLMVLECESFYHLYKQLEEFGKMPTLCEGMEKSQGIIDDYVKRHEDIPSLRSPLVVNGALAAELALKFPYISFVSMQYCKNQSMRKK